MAVKKRKKEKKRVETKEPTNRKEQIKKENLILRNILIGIVVVMAGIFLIMVLFNSINNFEYHGVKFNVVKFCDAGPPCLITYKTSLPVKVEGKNVFVATPQNKTADYNFYLRNDPRKLEVDFNGTLVFKENMVLNSEEDFVCDGKGAIAGANLNQLYRILEVNVIKDENATCDSLGRYMFVDIKPGNETRIEQTGPACYDIYIKNCEVLEGTEKFMIETFVKVNEILRE